MVRTQCPKQGAAGCKPALRSAAVPAAATSAGVGTQDCSHTGRRPTFLRPRTGALLVLGCWLLGCWIVGLFDVRCWMFDVGCSMLDVRCSRFSVQGSTLHASRF